MISWKVLLFALTIVALQAEPFIIVEKSGPLNGTVELHGSKHSALGILASLVLTKGSNRLTNVPFTQDIRQMLALLSLLGARVDRDEGAHVVTIDTSTLKSYKLNPELLTTFRASILLVGPLLARFNRVEFGQPGGCAFTPRPINFHIKALSDMGAQFFCQEERIIGQAHSLYPVNHILEYPSVGTTQNILMAASSLPGVTRIENAALEPEVIELIEVLRKMGAQITIREPRTIEIQGTSSLHPIEHKIMFDRIEAGSLILAAAITGGEIALPEIPHSMLSSFLDKLRQMGHEVLVGDNGKGIWFKASSNPQAVSFTTEPHPGFPTDLQPPMMAVQTLASGTSIVRETVWSTRFTHVLELLKMGADITVEEQTATIKGVTSLQGTRVTGTDIRSTFALIIAGLAAEGKTKILGLIHLIRGYENIINQINQLGGTITIIDEQSE